MSERKIWAPIGGPALAAVVLTVLCAVPAAAQNAEDWRQGVNLFEQGRYEEALDHLDRYIATNPSSEDALRARNEVGYQTLVQMLSRKDDIATIARKVLELAERGERFDVPQRERITELIRALMAGQYEDRYTAMNELVTQVGPFAVPYLVEYLADRHDDDRRATAIITLSRLGPDGTNAVVELLYHEDDYVRENACHVLGHIRDIKALPYLKAVSERREESPHVVRAAEQALENMTGKATGHKSAVALFHALGELYYQEHPSVMVNNFKQWTLWDWAGERMSFRIVPSYAWNDEMAENVCYDALDHARRANASEAELDRVFTLLVSAHFSEVVEVDRLLEVADAKAAAGDIDQDAYQELKERKARILNLAALSAGKGEAQVAKALKKAMQDRRVPLAVALIEQLRDMRMSESLLPAAGADLAAFLASDAGEAPAALQVERRQPAATATPAARTVPAPGPAPAAPRSAPNEERMGPSEPANEPETQPADDGDEAPRAPRRRRISQAEADAAAALVAEAYGPEVQRTLQAGGAAHGAALAAALTYDDKRVRYAAAEALVRLAPNNAFAGADKVWEALAGALGESGSRVVLIVAADQQVRNRMVGIVRSLHHLPFAVSSAKEAVLRARTAATQDVVIVHSKFRADDFSTTQLLDELRKDYRTKGLPVLVVAPKHDVRDKKEHFAAGGLEPADVLPDDVDEIMLKDRLEALWTGDYARPNDPKRKSVEVARQAAEAIASADPRTSILGLERTIPALLQAIEFQPDEVRIPALRALGILETRQALDKAAIIFANDRNGRNVRIAAAFCLGGALKGQAVPSKVFESFIAAMTSGDRGLYKACGEALGKMQLSREQALELFLSQRVE